MSNALRALRAEKHIPAQAIIAALRLNGYAGFDKSLLSKAENSERYGIQLTPGAMATLYKTFDPEKTTAPRKDTHRLRHAVRARLTDHDFSLLQQRVRADGYATMQDWLADRISSQLKGGAQNE